MKKKCWNLTSFEGITSFSAGLRLGAPLTLLAASTKPSFVWNKRGEIRFILWLPALCSSSIQSSLTPPLCDDMRAPGPLPAARSQRDPSIWPRCSAAITGPFNTSNCSTFDTLSRQLLGIIPAWDTAMVVISSQTQTQVLWPFVRTELLFYKLMNRLGINCGSL